MNQYAIVTELTESGYTPPRKGYWLEVVEAESEEKAVEEWLETWKFIMPHEKILAVSTIPNTATKQNRHCTPMKQFIAPVPFKLEYSHEMF